jgi:hypothetical protein
MAERKDADRTKYNQADRVERKAERIQQLVPLPVAESEFNQILKISSAFLFHFLLRRLREEKFSSIFAGPVGQ